MTTVKNFDSQGRPFWTNLVGSNIQRFILWKDAVHKKIVFFSLHVEKENYDHPILLLTRHAKNHFRLDFFELSAYSKEKPKEQTLVNVIVF